MQKEFGERAQSDKEKALQKQNYPFYSYAADHWGTHLRLMNVSTGEKEKQKDAYQLALRFLFDGNKVINAIQSMSDYRIRSERMVSALHLAAYFGLDELTKKLIKKDFPPNTVTRCQETALHWAALYQYHDVVAALVTAGANVNIVDSDGKTALHQAVMKEDVASVDALLAAAPHVDLELEDRQQWTPLRWAAAYGNCTLIKKLVTDGRAKIEAEDRNGFTALRWEVKRGHEAAINTLW